MTNNFRITYEVEGVECDQFIDEIEVFVENVLRGAVTIYFDARSIRIRPCGLLRVSRSFVRLCTFPILYGVEASESILEYGIDFRSVYDSECITVEMLKVGKDNVKIKASIRASDALRIAGEFHKNVLIEIFNRCPRMMDENLLLLKIPDAFPLSFLARTGTIGLEKVSLSG